MVVAAKPAGKPEAAGKPAGKKGGKVVAIVKLAIEAGKANPAPPIGPALGSKVRRTMRHF